MGEYKEMLLQITDVYGTIEYKLENFGKEYITFGRNEDQDIVLQDTNVSRRHGYFMKYPEGWTIGNNSTNGIVLNGKIIKSAFIRPGDNIVLSVKHQEQTVRMFVRESSEIMSDRVSDARSTNRYLHITSDQSDVLRADVYNVNEPYNLQKNQSQNIADFLQCNEGEKLKSNFNWAVKQDKIQQPKNSKNSKNSHKTIILIVSIILGVGIVWIAVILIIWVIKDNFLGYINSEMKTAEIISETIKELSIEKENLIDSTLDVTSEIDSGSYLYNFTDENLKDNNKLEISSVELTSDMACKAVEAYCREDNPSLNDMNSEEHIFYWLVEEETSTDYTILYRSYTEVLSHYYVDIESGNVTLVQEEVEDTVTYNDLFNIWDYVQ